MDLLTWFCNSQEKTDSWFKVPLLQTHTSQAFVSAVGLTCRFVFVSFFLLLFFKFLVFFLNLAADHRASLAAATNCVSTPEGLTFRKHTCFPVQCAAHCWMSLRQIRDGKHESRGVVDVTQLKLLTYSKEEAWLLCCMFSCADSSQSFFLFCFWLNSTAPRGVLLHSALPSISHCPESFPLFTLLVLLLCTPLTTLQCFVHTLLSLAVPGCSAASLTCHTRFMSLVATHQDPLC